MYRLSAASTRASSRSATRCCPATAIRSARCCWCVIPIREAWSLAFQTSVPGEVAGRFDEEYVGVFIPTTPSPVNGFYFYVRKADTIELDMSVDVALRSIVSMGVVACT